MIVFAFLFAAVLILALGTALIGPKNIRRGALGIAVVGLLGTLGFGIGSSGYVQDAGTGIVVKSFTGTIEGSTDTAGWHLKNPFSSTVEFDVRNQQVLFAAAATNTDGQEAAHGATITVSDADGVSSDIDVAVNYSIDGTKVVDIYKQYQSAENYQDRYITQSIRSAVRATPNSFHTLDLITQKKKLEDAIYTAIQTKWAGQDQGKYLTLEGVSLQNVTPPKSITDAYAAAQNAQIEVSTEQNKLSAAKVSAQQQVVQATASAEANKILEKSLTPQVLKQHTLDTLKSIGASGNMVITDGTGSTLLNINKK